MPKENLIIVHSFPGNSILLSGLIEYLNDYFEVYFINLPGFAKSVPPLTEISFKGYVQFIEEKIRGFGLASYWLAGISLSVFKNLPYILVANEDDQTLDYDYTLKAFTKNAAWLLIVFVALVRPHLKQVLVVDYWAN